MPVVVLSLHIGETCFVRKLRNWTPNVKFVCCKLNIIGCRTFYFRSFYRSPNQNEEEYLEAFNKFLARILLNKSAHVLVEGDFNCGNIE